MFLLSFAASQLFAAPLSPLFPSNTAFPPPLPLISFPSSRHLYPTISFPPKHVIHCLVCPFDPLRSTFPSLVFHYRQTTLHIHCLFPFSSTPLTISHHPHHLLPCVFLHQPLRYHNQLSPHHNQLSLPTIITNLSLSPSPPSFPFLPLQTITTTTYLHHLPFFGTSAFLPRSEREKTAREQLMCAMVECRFSSLRSLVIRLCFISRRGKLSKSPPGPECVCLTL